MKRSFRAKQPNIIVRVISILSTARE